MLAVICMLENLDYKKMRYFYNELKCIDYAKKYAPYINKMMKERIPIIWEQAGKYKEPLNITKNKVKAIRITKRDLNGNGVLWYLIRFSILPHKITAEYHIVAFSDGVIYDSYRNQPMPFKTFNKTCYNKLVGIAHKPKRKWLL